MKGTAPVYNGGPKSELVIGGGATALSATNGGIVRAKAAIGNSYVMMGPPTGVTPGASNAFYLEEGDTIDMYGQPGDRALSADA